MNSYVNCSTVKDIMTKINLKSDYAGSNLMLYSTLNPTKTATTINANRNPI